MTLYAIKDLESGLYVSHRTPRRLVELGPEAKFFSSRSDAMRLIENRIHPLIPTTDLQNDLAWDLLEKLYATDRWHINCDKDEYHDAVNQFKNLKVVVFQVIELDDNEESKKTD